MLGSAAPLEHREPALQRSEKSGGGGADVERDPSWNGEYRCASSLFPISTAIHYIWTGCESMAQSSSCSWAIFVIAPISADLIFIVICSSREAWSALHRGYPDFQGMSCMDWVSVREEQPCGELQAKECI